MDKLKKFFLILLCIFMILFITWFVYSHVIEGIMMYERLNIVSQGVGALEDLQGLWDEALSHIK